ncbi:structure-specific endonuclease subunit SLX4 [Ochlerotatus camptorhynchus]|uniref:structure-specific endonuclease subunit SLX4 n=1 Tax=Ochlerotatus camptorhynchus TaxID=644619 RepID=UPI0031D175D0
MASGSGRTKIKYAKLRLFKPSPSGSRSQPDLEKNEGKHPKTPPSEAIERMEQEIIHLSDSDDAGPSAKEPDEPIVKRTRLDGLEGLQMPEKSKLPKFPKKPPEGGGVVSNFFKISEDDFESEVKKGAPPKAKTKVQRKAKAPRKPRAPRKPKNQSDIRKVFQKYKDNDEELLKNLMLEHTLMDRLDPEQFQIALAMSRSLVDQGDSQTDSKESQEQTEEEPKASSSANSLSSEERRIQGIRNTLEQYGFKCKNSYTDYDLNVIFGNVPKNVKRIKHKRPTMLIRRDPEDVVDFMGRQAKRLLQEDLDQQFPDCSDVVLNERTHGSTVFWMSQNPANSAEILSDYYVEALVEMSAVRAGYLLKSWSMIPGRERTPERRLAKEDDDEDEWRPSPVVEKCEELLEDPEDSKLDMNSVPEEYRQKYNNQAPIHVRALKRTENARDSEKGRRSVSPDLFASDSGGEQSVQELVEVQETAQDEGEDDVVFLTAQEEMVGDEAEKETEQSKGIVRAASSENIFEDSDPIFDYEVYSSEEAKMSSSLPGENNPSERPCSESHQSSIVMDPLVVVLSPSSTEDDTDKSNQNAPTACKRTSSSAIGSGIKEKEQRFDDQLFPTPGKDLSFHALAIKGKLNRIPLSEVETIELDNDCDEVKKAFSEPEVPAEESIENQSSDRSGTSLISADTGDDPEDVLVISDDEVNYSIRQDYSVVFNVSPMSASVPVPEEALVVDPEPLNPSDLAKTEEDLENTKVYFNVEDFKRLSSEANVSNEQLENFGSGPADVPNESNRADNTMAFLDGLVKKFNLPPTLSKQSTCDEANEIGLDDYMQNYEVPDFPDNQLDGDDVQNESEEKPTPIPSEQLDLEIEQILSQAKQTCTQFQQRHQLQARGSPIRRTRSDSVLVGPGKRKSPGKLPMAKRKDCFDDKFKELAQDPAPPSAGIEIRLDSVSPRPDFDGMASPLLHRELFKFGLKQLSRPKAVKMLTHIYNQLHPMVDIVEVEEPEPCGDSNVSEGVTPLPSQPYFVPEMEDEEFILPSKPRKKTFWCAVPLHIAFHNMVSADPRLRRQMLRYQPIDLDEVYGHLKEIGLRYESNDLIAFLDKRCITFRTAQGSGSRTKKGTIGQTQTARKTAGKS